MKSLSASKLRRHLERLQESLPAALIKRFVEADLITQAASLSFYTLLSLAPLLVLLLWLTASLYPPAQASLVAQIGSLAGDNAAAVAETVIRNADEQPDIGSLAGVWSTVLLFVGSTVVFAQLQGALNLIFRTGGEQLGGLKAWLRKRVFSLGVVLALGFLLIVSMIATTALQLVFSRLPSLLPAIGYTSTLLLYALAFAFLYHYLPDRRVAWRQAWLGGAITAGLFARIRLVSEEAQTVGLIPDRAVGADRLRLVDLQRDAPAHRLAARDERVDAEIFDREQLQIVERARHDGGDDDAGFCRFLCDGGDDFL